MHADLLQYFWLIVYLRGHFAVCQGLGIFMNKSASFFCIAN